MHSPVSVFHSQVPIRATRCASPNRRRSWLARCSAARNLVTSCTVPGARTRLPAASNSACARTWKIRSPVGVPDLDLGRQRLGAGGSRARNTPSIDWSSANTRRSASLTVHSGGMPHILRMPSEKYAWPAREVDAPHTDLGDLLHAGEQLEGVFRRGRDLFHQRVAVAGQH